MFAGYDSIIDARSPAEYEADHIPGAISAPVLGNEERARIGTIYKQVSPFEARKLGAVLVARNISRHVENLFLGKPKAWKPLVYCWRGGKRSAAFVHVLREIGWDAVALEGGYRSYRRWVVDRLNAIPGKFRFKVIHGATGSGKSRLLRALASAGAQVLDLEDLAAHRGSVLGGLPDRPQPTQKGFETGILQALSGMNAEDPIFVEAESRKIGQLQVPDALIGAMRASECLRLEAGVPVRVALLLEEYRHFLADRAALEAQLDCLTALHGRERIGEWKALAAAAQWPELVRRLLVEHYDPAYLRSSHGNFRRLKDAAAVGVDAADEAAFRGVAENLLRDKTLETVA